VQAIVEEAQCTPAQLVIRELNVGVYCFDSDWLWEALARVPLSPKGEYYLTDTVGLATEAGLSVQAITMEDPADAMGINTRVHLAEAEAIVRARTNKAWMESGVTMPDPGSVFIEKDVVIGRDTVIMPHTYLRGKTQIGENCVIGPSAIIDDCQIGDDCKVLMSVLEKAVMDNGADIGPFGRLRKGAHLGEGVHMGNFGEVKESYLAAGVKMGHFSYIGNATIGEDVNIGAGTITCNYDGVNKYPTEIGAGTFIGSDTMLVAPLKIGENAITGAGAVVKQDVADNEVVAGVPARPINQKK
jgi:bifunctional UDP-N-acetylglucosamine pyrophosphorylase/glucosamine-1-phosphate N-acetyltransferase